MTAKINGFEMPDRGGCFGEYGGRYVPEQLEKILDEILIAYEKIRDDDDFKKELQFLYKNYAGRPSPIFYAKNLSRKTGGARIYLKREDLNHTGAHKINHCLGEVLLAKKMGKTKVIAETGAGSHGVALATAATLLGLECDIYMGEIDIAKAQPTVIRMKILGANIVPVHDGGKTLKEAVDAALDAYFADPVSQFYAIGSVVGPHPFPMMVRDFQQIVGIEAREQFQAETGLLPDYLVACVGGGSNAIGLFTAFLEDHDVQLYGVEPAGFGPEVGQHAMTLTMGTPGVLHGFKSYLLQNDRGEPSSVHSVASGLDYPGVGPQHSLLKDIGRVNYASATDQEAVDAFFELSKAEGIVPALESAHAVAYAMKLARGLDQTKTILVNLSGRGDKDIDFVVEHYGKDHGIVL
ncbi:MAG: tryptophan synthase subunit beta [Syntrophobacterales bacterium]|jgi:tryptophan synthase beta chain|nr:tryptophan synthase subunit beta [Syntrophobacterales bacterium]